MNNPSSRTALSVLNILSGLGSKLVVSVIKLLSRVVFFHYLSAELYGVSGLFSNVLGLLALAELGMGTAITFSLYQPLAKNDKEKIRSLVFFYQKAYRIISLTVTVLGIALVPVLPLLIRDYQGIDHFYLIYFLFLANMVIEYLLSYKRTLANAAQESFRLVPFTTGFEALIALSQILIIFLLHEDPNCFLYYLGIQTAYILLQNLVINRYLDKKYPVLTELKGAAPLEPGEKKEILVNIKALLYHKVGGVVVAGTDNLLISAMVDLVTVGFYSNYSSMIATVAGIVYLFIGNTTASFGNLIAKEAPEKRLSVFQELQFLNYALYGICTAFFLSAFQPFISFAYGEQFTLSFPIVILVVVANFYLLGLTYPLDVVKSAAGLYDQDKWIPIVQSVVNLGISILLGIPYGLVGIFLGTLISTLIPLLAKPFIIYRHVFEASPIPFFKNLVRELLTVVLICAASLGLSYLVSFPSPLIQLLYNLFVTLIAAPGIFLFLHRKSPYLPALFGRIKNLIGKKG